MHAGIYAAVGDAVSRIAHLECEWGPDEITKKVVRYIFKAASDSELLQMRWEEICKEFVERAFQGYSSACAEMSWFYEIDLVPTFVQAALELIMASGQQVSPAGVQEIVHAEYEDKLDRTMLDKAFWDVTKALVSDEKAAGKLRNNLSKAYWPALDEVLNDGTLHREMMYGLDQNTELKRVESFVKRWLDDAMSRSWAALENAGEAPGPEMLSELLRHLIAPFGTESPFSCLPAALTEGLGRPPPDWAFIRTCSTELIAIWNGEIPHPAAKRRRKGPPRRGGGAWQEDSVAVEEPEELGGGGGGCPKCTSEEDCIGSPVSPLIRHMHNGKAGDIYCKPCWESFRQRNPSLKGVPEEG
mmetsp:Transcript_20179/g.46633  ORF Transcript_20179/g.46633 Transcript_20179/m.46633 type:complete len:357 (-) Transcript_20179:20-1090(-)